MGALLFQDHTRFVTDDSIDQYGLERHLLNEEASSMNYARFDLKFVESLQLGTAASLVHKIPDPPPPEVLLTLKFIGKGALCVRTLSAADRDAAVVVLMRLRVMREADVIE